MAGVIETPAKDRVELRLASLSAELEGLLDEVRPDAVAVEKIFFQTNVKTAISVAQASGVILATAARREIPIALYTPNEVKQAVVGYGSASKVQVQEMVGRLCGLEGPLEPPDVADAMALAMCHLTNQRLSQAISTGQRA